MTTSITNRVIDWLIQNYPMFFWILVIIAVVSYITWKLSKFHSDCKDCRDRGKDSQSIKKDLSRLSEKINTLLTLLLEKDIIKNKDLFSTNSPLKLTEKGVGLVDQVGWKKVLDDENSKNVLFESLDKLKLNSKYDVEKYSIVILHELNSQRENNPFTPIKKYLYEHSDLDERNIIFACALYLRDRYLEKRSDLKD